ARGERARGPGSGRARLGLTVGGRERCCLQNPGNRQRESTTASGSAAHTESTTQQSSYFTTDRQAQARSTIASIGASIYLLEGFEDHPLLVLRNANTGVGNFEAYPGIVRGWLPIG